VSRRQGKTGEEQYRSMRCVKLLFVDGVKFVGGSIFDQAINKLDPPLD
jgi:hypothetical protein